MAIRGVEHYFCAGKKTFDFIYPINYISKVYGIIARFKAPRNPRFRLSTA
jgi:hypothetical protein